MEEKVNVVFATDKDYFQYTCVALFSLLEHKKDDTFYEIFIFYGQWEARDKWEKTIGLFQKLHNNCRIHLVGIYDKCFEKAEFSDYFSIATYYRLFLAEYLQDIEKCIYLDSDILILDDLSDFFSTDISDVYFAGVKDLAISLGKDVYVSTIEKLGLPKDYLGYINAGSILVNLKKIRDDQIITKFKELIETEDKKYINNDQDIINMICKKQIKLLPLKYNLPSMCLEFCPGNILRDMCIDLKELEEEKKIIHFLGSIKPWQSIMIKGSELWWNYAEQTVKKFALPMIKMNNYEFFLNWTGLIQLLKKQEHIYVWGYTETAKDLVCCLKKSGIINIDGIFDNDHKKLDLEYDGIKVIPYDATIYKNAFIIITSYNFFHTIKNQILNSGVAEENIFLYRKWSRLDILTISGKYHKNLIRYILEKEFGVFEEDVTALKLWKMIQKCEERKEILVHEYALDSWLIDIETGEVRKFD